MSRKKDIADLVRAVDYLATELGVKENYDMAGPGGDCYPEEDGIYYGAWWRNLVRDIETVQADRKQSDMLEIAKRKLTPHD